MLTTRHPQDRNPVGSFWWKEIINLFGKFQTITSCKTNKGDTISFWTQPWIGHDQILRDRYPQLYSFSRKQKCSLHFFIEQDINRVFSLPLSQQAADQLLHIENHIESSNINENQNDIWSYYWGSRRYSSKKAYAKLQGYTEASPLFSWLWGSSNLGKHKFFFWLLLRDRLSTRNLLRRKNMFLQYYSCVLCNTGHEETLFHLFFECPFSTSCWQSISIH